MKRTTSALFKSTVSAAVMFVMFLNMLPTYAAWDGLSSTKVTTVSLFDFNNFSNILTAGGIPVRTRTTAGNSYSIRWTNHTASGTLKIHNFPSNVPSDWSDCNMIKLKVYSEKATNAQLLLQLNSPSPKGHEGGYYYTKFNIDWEGWKTIKLNLSSLGTAYDPDYSQITELNIVANGGWGLVGNPESDLYIASIDLLGGETAYDFVSMFYDEDIVNSALKAMTGSAAVYAGGSNVVTDEGASQLNYDIEYKNSTVMVPTRFFQDYVGQALQDKVTDALKDESYQKDALTYVPALKAAELMGIEAFQDNRLFVAGTAKTVAELSRPESLGVNKEEEIISQMAYKQPVVIDGFTPEDCDYVKDNWRRMLVGDETTNDLGDEDIATRVQTISKNGKNAWDSIIKGNPEDEIIVGMTSTSTAEMGSAYGTVQNMAKAYACYGGEYYHNEELFNDIVYALEWLKDHRFSAEGKASWIITGFDNWWYWYIGVPQSLMDILICIEDRLTEEQIYDFTDYYVTNHSMPTSTGANYSDMSFCIIGAALLRNDYKKILMVQTDFQRLYLYGEDREELIEGSVIQRDFYVEDKASTFFTDGSYICHGLNAMNGAYGMIHFDGLAKMEKLFKGSVFQQNTSLRDNVPDFFFNALDPVIYGTTMYRSVVGRNVGVDNITGGVSTLIDVFQIADCFDEDIQEELYGIVKAAYQNSLTPASFISNLEIDDVKKFKELMQDDSIKPRTGYKTSRVFYNMDKTVHSRDDWSLGVAMSSSRMYNYECINNQNLTGWYLSDGRTEYYLKGSNMNATASYFNNIDPYRMPGTTVDTQERKAVSIANDSSYLSSKDFVGGVALQDEYSAAAMELESYHFDEDFGIDSGSYGGKAPAHTSDLTAKKVYFMLDDGVVCLGNSVNAKNNNNAEVLTIVENLLANTTVNLSEDEEGTKEPYTIVSAVASDNPQPENMDYMTIDGDLSTRWAAESGAELVWDIGSVQPLGFASISLQNGSKRTQTLQLAISEDGVTWETVFDGKSSGKTEINECFDLQGKMGRYVKYINYGNSHGSAWVSLTECSIYPPNDDGSVGFKEANIYGNDEVIVDGHSYYLVDKEYDFTDASWISMDGRCGYYFPKENLANGGAVKAHWTKGTNSYFELWYSHGVNPTDGSYAYVLLPGATTEETKAFAESDNISILANNALLQAVKDNRTNVTYLVFWQKGSFAGVTVQQPCMVIMREQGDELVISVSDPTQKLNEGSVVIDGTFYAVDLDDSAVLENGENTTTLTYAMTNSDGRSFESTLTKQKNQQSGATVGQKCSKGCVAPDCACDVNCACESQS